MIKVNNKLEEFLNLVKPIKGVKKIKLSSFRHPFHAREDHDLIKERIMAFSNLTTK